jgi:hypothetical protein
MAKNIKRIHFNQQITDQLRIHPICCLLGPRQVGKTTLAREYAQEYFAGNVHVFDLENALDLARLDNPMLAFNDVPETFIIIDEIQKRPDLFPILRVLVDQPENKKKFLILGSASRDLIQQSSQTLAGRIGYIELYPFSLGEVADSKQLWLRGGFPKSYLAGNNADSFSWRQSYITTFLERDIADLGFVIPPVQMRRFWMMLVHYHGQIFNASELGRSLGVSDHTVRKYLDILAGTFMIRIVQPWFENLQKRQIKSPKIYFRDSGILHALEGIVQEKQLATYYKLGAFWEGFALEEIIKMMSVALGAQFYFWATQADAELDLLVMYQGQRIGFEFKYTDAPKITKSMVIAQQDLKLDKIFVIYPGKQIFPLSEKIRACGLDAINPQIFEK